MARDKRRHHHDWPFPFGAIILLAIGVIWFLNDLQILNVNIPWVPTIIIVIAIGMLVRFKMLKKWISKRR